MRSILTQFHLIYTITLVNGHWKSEINSSGFSQFYNCMARSASIDTQGLHHLSNRADSFKITYDDSKNDGSGEHVSPKNLYSNPFDRSICPWDRKRSSEHKTTTASSLKTVLPKVLLIGSVFNWLNSSGIIAMQLFNIVALKELRVMAFVKEPRLIRQVDPLSLHPCFHPFHCLSTPASIHCMTGQVEPRYSI